MESETFMLLEQLIEEYKEITAELQHLELVLLTQRIFRLHNLPYIEFVEREITRLQINHIKKKEETDLTRLMVAFNGKHLGLFRELIGNLLVANEVQVQA